MYLFLTVLRPFMHLCQLVYTASSKDIAAISHYRHSRSS